MTDSTTSTRPDGQDDFDIESWLDEHWHPDLPSVNGGHASPTPDSHIRCCRPPTGGDGNEPRPVTSPER